MSNTLNPVTNTQPLLEGQSVYVMVTDFTDNSVAVCCEVFDSKLSGLNLQDSIEQLSKRVIIQRIENNLTLNTLANLSYEVKNNQQLELLMRFLQCPCGTQYEKNLFTQLLSSGIDLIYTDKTFKSAVKQYFKVAKKFKKNHKGF